LRTAQTETESLVAKPVVLVVDDVPECVEMMAAILEGSYTVRQATSGRRALQLAMQEPMPDLILLDVVMPEMDGHAVLAALRADPRTRDIPVIFISSLQQASAELECLAEGAADFLVKPAAHAVVQARVRSQIQLKQTRDSLRERNRALQAEVRARAALEEKLKSTIADLQAFSYSVSHDLRSPLGAIGSFATALLEDEGQALSPNGLHWLERIVAGSSRMNRMIDDILACSRAEFAEMREESVDLRTMAADAIAESLHLNPSARATVGPMPRVRADRLMIQQVFSNLIGNAMKFSSDRPDAFIRVESRELDGMLEISVRDNGAGFDPAYSDKLFGLFQRLHRDGEFPGTGVGLSIVKRLVTRHGGTIRAESIPGSWTTFTFTLPLDEHLCF
jgi:two-component system sensor histidine kinase/response regulator